MIWEVYALSDPKTKAIRYIGITRIGIARRLRAHLSRSANARMVNWVSGLKARGTAPIARVLAEIETDDPSIGRSHERAWILRMKREGHPLLNMLNLAEPMPWWTAEEVRARAIVRAERALASAEKRTAKAKARLEMLRAGAKEEERR